MARCQYSLMQNVACDAEDANKYFGLEIGGCRANGGTGSRLPAACWVGLLELDARLDATGMRRCKSVGCNQGLAIFGVMHCRVHVPSLMGDGKAAVCSGSHYACFFRLHRMPRDLNSGDVLFADVAFGEQTSPMVGKPIDDLWQAHHADPANPAIRRFLGLPLKGDFESTAKRGRGSTALAWLEVGFVRPGRYSTFRSLQSRLIVKTACEWLKTWSVVIGSGPRCSFHCGNPSAQVSLALKEMGDESVCGLLSGE